MRLVKPIACTADVWTKIQAPLSVTPTALKLKSACKMLGITSTVIASVVGTPVIVTLSMLASQLKLNAQKCLTQALKNTELMITELGHCLKVVLATFRLTQQWLLHV